VKTYYSKSLDKTYQLLDREQGEVLVKAGCIVLMWYAAKQRYTLSGDLRLRNIRAREIKNLAHGRKLWPSTERSFEKGTMMFAVETE
jgi:hypothetical protein